jgi:hypothetical protein
LVEWNLDYGALPGRVERDSKRLLTARICAAIQERIRTRHLGHGLC